jgi:hypothetical protein
MELKPDLKEMTAIKIALRKAFIAPRGIFSGYLSCLSEQDKMKLNKMHKGHGKQISLKAFANKIRLGEFEYRLFVQ